MNRTINILLLSVIIASGLIGSGYFIGQGFYKAKASERSITVRGLAIQDVKANLAIWELNYKRVGADLVQLNQAMQHDQDAVISFLKAKGFSPEEIEIKPVRVKDILTDPYLNLKNENAAANRFIVSGSVQVRTKRIDLVRDLQSVNQLLNQGIPLSFETSDYGPNPSYLFTELDSIRPTMLAAATKSARLVAEQFAKDSNSELGQIRRANQGLFQILPAEGTGEGDSGQRELASPNKKVRLVITVEYLLK